MQGAASCQGAATRPAKTQQHTDTCILCMQHRQADKGALVEGGGRGGGAAMIV
eukprot:CAMPEP_0202859566 /NCGR_PEP_ID=MMETSP1391-20130828/1625_1 /ASSEMBLY_ACC=CAM_ASM_000867 /TAXON_ID=1034604 /ORGANISM="Chlamydomonas leiostraca, Strain SAG 11-49" /LENGTH=52 /DNA_ID=CAMNT_0049538611 /DNA_START=380 /DNA_END=538 /DNA_ORIENTATION=-